MNYFLVLIKQPIELFKYILRYFRGLSISQMWGRSFDLRKKRLVSMDGFSLFVMPNDYIGRSILKTRTYEPHVTTVIRRELKEGDVFLDVGANIGYFTMLASSLVNESGKVIAIEPNPQNLQLIYYSLLENRTNNVKIYPYAASDVTAILKFTTIGSNGGVITEYSKDQKYYLLVPSVILDEILEDESRIDLIKIDIEAHEPIAIKGMESLIKKHRPKIITEFHPWAMELNNITPPAEYLENLIELGYGLSVIESDGNCLEVTDAGGVISYWEKLGRETAHLDLFAIPVQ